MEFGLDVISKYISTCTSCKYNRNGDCGFINPCYRAQEPEPLTLAIYEDMSAKEFELYESRVNGYPCSDQLSVDQLMDAVENTMERIDIELSPDQAKRIVSHCYKMVERCRRSSASEDFEANVRSALNIVLSYLDLNGLEHGKDFIEELKLYPYDYTRERGLLRYCPRVIAEGYLANINKNSALKNEVAEISNLRKTPASQTISLDACSPIENLIDQIGRYKIACLNETPCDAIDWSYLDGTNKERFVVQLRAMNSLDSEQYERTILFVWDRLITTYNDISEILSKLDKRESLYSRLLPAEQEVISYIAAAYLHATFRPVDYCYRSILNKMRKELEGINGQKLLERSADYCGISYELMLSYRNSQCEKCKVKGCIGRVSDKHGILELVGPGLDSLLFKNEGVKSE